MNTCCLLDVVWAENVVLCYRRSEIANIWDMADLGWDYGFGEVDTGLVNMQPKSAGIKTEQDCEGDKSTSWSTGQSGTCIMDQWKSAVDESSPCSTSSQYGGPICRQFWKAGIYNDDLAYVSKSHAIAELLDNAVDEIQNDATYVILDKTSNPRDGSPALFIQDDGAGMDPEAMRKCLSFGFSDKKSESSIGKCMNMLFSFSLRLGADAIVFTRKSVDKTVTQSIGLLSYTFLTRSGYDRIVVPMVHYKFNIMTGSFESLQPESDRHSDLNISVLLQWSPYSTEKELLDQFGNIGFHGTKIIVYNLWLDDDGNMELDFESDPEVSNSSLLYIFCGYFYHVIPISQKHNLVQDIRLAWDGKTNAKDYSNKAITDNHIAYRLRHSLRHPEFIVYKPQGVLEADSMEPTHSKQDFEKTNVYQKLVTRLKLMTLEYWDYHCGLLGYKIPKKALPSYASGSCPKEGSNLKRKLPDHTEGSPSENVTETTSGAKMDQKMTLLMQENKRLKQQCLELEKGEKELDLKELNNPSSL
ncbi:hypothetical protein L1987_22946 [Smallanthus sonchifolius]|uniref:Uncharacterized protein n=1 Tax=Smallanthus sonchifolius TaxID=185202 RepID=A0ACB9IHR4_9ASTR|nr:hypothetical protein L1987_22946 [Smallanthus sonchifolius]